MGVFLWAVAARTLRDAWDARGTDLVIGLPTGALSALIAGLAGHWEVAAWFGLGAYAVVFVLSLGYFLVGNLRGTNRDWRAAYEMKRPSEGQPQIWFVLHDKHLYLHDGADVTLWLRSPAGWEGDAKNVAMWRGEARVHVVYPDWFEGSPKPVDGIYTVVWRESDRSGKSRVACAQRANVQLAAVG
jgi:hypothetical protein